MIDRQFVQKRTKKGSRSLGSAGRNYPPLLANNGRHRKVAPLRVLRRVANPFFAALLRETAQTAFTFLLGIILAESYKGELFTRKAEQTVPKSQERIWPHTPPPGSSPRAPPARPRQSSWQCGDHCRSLFPLHAWGHPGLCLR